jgi:MFS family permease
VWVKPKQTAIALSTILFIGNIVAIPLLIKFGRRPLFLIGTGVSTLCLILCAILFSSGHYNYALISFILLAFITAAFS